MGDIIVPGNSGANRRGGALSMQILATQMLLWGEQANYHLERFKAKLAKFPWESGLELYPCELLDCQTRSSLCAWTLRTGLEVLLPLNTVGLIIPKAGSLEKLNGGIVQGGKLDAGNNREIFLTVCGYTFNQTEINAAIALAIARRSALAELVPTMALVVELVVKPLELPWTEARRLLGATEL